VTRKVRINKITALISRITVTEPKPHTKIWITCAGKYFNLLFIHIMSNITSSSGVVSTS